MPGWIDSVTGADPDAEIVLPGVSMGGAAVPMPFIHGDAADADPELYWGTVTAFVGKYVSE